MCAWTLLTIGLCIVVTAFYLAITHDTNCPNQISIGNTVAGDAVDQVDDAAADMNASLSNSSSQMATENVGTFNNKTGR